MTGKASIPAGTAIATTVTLTVIGWLRYVAAMNSENDVSQNLGDTATLSFLRTWA